MTEVTESGTQSGAGKRAAPATPTAEELQAQAHVIKGLFEEMRHAEAQAGLSIVRFAKGYIPFVDVLSSNGNSGSVSAGARRELATFKFSDETIQRYRLIATYARELESIHDSLPSSLESIYEVARMLKHDKQNLTQYVKTAVKERTLTQDSTREDIRNLRREAGGGQKQNKKPRAEASGSGSKAIKTPAITQATQPAPDAASKSASSAVVDFSKTAALDFTPSRIVRTEPVPVVSFYKPSHRDEVVKRIANNPGIFKLGVGTMDANGVMRGTYTLDTKRGKFPVALLTELAHVERSVNPVDQDNL
jgi:hypothetical protein